MKLLLHITNHIHWYCASLEISRFITFTSHQNTVRVLGVEMLLSYRAQNLCIIWDEPLIFVCRTFFALHQHQMQTQTQSLICNFHSVIRTRAVFLWYYHFSFILCSQTMWITFQWITIQSDMISVWLMNCMSDKLKIICGYLVKIGTAIFHMWTVTVSHFNHFTKDSFVILDFYFH